MSDAPEPAEYDPFYKRAGQSIEDWIAAYKAAYGASPDPAEVTRYRKILAKREARKREKMLRTGSKLDVPKRRKVTANPFSFAVARAKVLLDRGESVAAIRRATWLDEGTIRKIREGKYVSDLPVAALELAKATEDSKLTIGAHLCLDEIIENPSKLRDATVQQLGTTMAILLDKRELLAGRPTSRAEHLHNLSEDQLDDAMLEASRELVARLKARGVDVSEAEYSVVDSGGTQQGTYPEEIVDPGASGEAE